MPRASILIPTHEHAATLPLAVASVQAQGVDDVEVLIVGDGVTEELRAVLAGLQADDPRIRFFDMPKGPRNGEINRHVALAEAAGEVVCYQCDDDLWLPGHLQAMLDALEDADFALAMHVEVDTSDRLRGYVFDIEEPAFVEPWLAWRHNGFGPWASDGCGLAFAAHRLDAYRRLPEGWSTAPDGLPTDQFMWHKFVSQPWCRRKYLPFPTALHFSAPPRRDRTPEQRRDELQRWRDIIAGADGMNRIVAGIMSDLGERLLQQRQADVERSTAIEAERDRALAAAEAASSECRILAERLRRLASGFDSGD